MTALSLPAGLAVSACEGGVHGGAQGSGSGSCAATMRFEGREYTAVTVEVSPATGGTLGTGVIPPCDDTGESTVATEKVTVVRFADVPPKEAVVLRSGQRSTVWVEKKVADRPNVLQPVRRLLQAPRCHTQGTFTVAGDWLSVPDPGNDLRPPYRLRVYVDTAIKETDRYARTFQTVRVTRTTQHQITDADIRDVLRRGGRIQAMVHCDSGRFVADELAPVPPGS